LPVPAAAQIAALTGRPVEAAQTHAHFGPERRQSQRGPPRTA
jgi:hypothetical protein